MDPAWPQHEFWLGIARPPSQTKAPAGERGLYVKEGRATMGPGGWEGPTAGTGNRGLIGLLGSVGVAALTDVYPLGRAYGGQVAAT